jgi:hypothetical protein
MRLIARTDGPNYNGIIGSGALTTGKEYELIGIAYAEDGNWKYEKTLNYNPRKPKFYIKVINDMGREADYWNDYFLSTEEMRDLKLNELGI